MKNMHDIGIRKTAKRTNATVNGRKSISSRQIDSILRIAVKAKASKHRQRPSNCRQSNEFSWTLSVGSPWLKSRSIAGTKDFRRNSAGELRSNCSQKNVRQTMESQESRLMTGSSSARRAARDDARGDCSEILIVFAQIGRKIDPANEER